MRRFVNRNSVVGYLAVTIVFLLGIGASVFWGVVQIRNVTAATKSNFNLEVDQLVTGINRHQQNLETQLNGLRDVFVTNANLDYREFRAIALPRSLEVEDHGVLGFGFVQATKSVEMPAMASRLMSEGAPAPAESQSPKEQHYVVRFIEPVEKNRLMLGLDLWDIPACREPLNRAIRDGQAVFTPYISFPRDASIEGGLLLLAPIFKKGDFPRTIEERKRDFIGFAIAAVDPAVFFGYAGGEQGRDVSVRVLDSRGNSQATAPESSVTGVQSASLAPRFQTRRAVKIGGTDFTLSVTSLPAFERKADYLSIWLYGGLGIILTTLVAIGVWRLESSRNDALLVAQEAGNDLVSAKAQVEAALRESETIIGTLDEHSIVSITDSKGIITSVNDAFCKISGYSREELIGNKHDMVNSGFHPRSFWTEVFRAAAAGRPWRGDVCNRAKDGSLYWVDSIIAPFKSSDGKIIKYISIRTDITERIKAINLAEQMAEDLSTAKAQVEAALRESETIIGTLDEHSIVSITDSKGIITSVNDAFCKISGYSREELIGNKHDMVNSGFHPRSFWTEVFRAAAAGRPWRGDVCNRAKDGSLYWVDSIIAPFKSSDGKIIKYISIRTDITERKMALDRLRDTEMFIARAGQIAGVGAWQYDVGADRFLLPDATCKLMGFSQNHAPTLNQFVEQFDEESQDEILSALHSAIDKHQAFDFEARVGGHRLGSIWWRVVGECEIDGGTATKLVGAIQDITDKRKAAEESQVNMDRILTQMTEIDLANQQLKQNSSDLRKLNVDLHTLATQDRLTALANRGEFYEQAAKARRDCSTLQDKYAVLFLDLDNFKFVNDSLGHDAGDQLLVQVAERLKLNVPETDLVARIGGDEFAVLLTSGGPDQMADQVAARLVQAMEQPFHFTGLQLTATCSIGVATGDMTSTVEDVIRNADTAMYHAKRSGKSAWTKFEKFMLDEVNARLQLERDLRRAWDERSLFLCYQPIVDLETGELHSLESLVRWTHPERGPISPAEFVPLAEELNLIVPMGLWILREACHTLKHLQLELKRPDLRISVNVSVQQLQHPSFYKDIVSVVEETGLTPDRITLEVTETVMVKTYESLSNLLIAIRGLGVHIAIDDFGTGYSSMGTLASIPADKVKIDQRFVASIGDTLGPTAILRALITLCKTLGLTVVAEGIEDESQLCQLQALGCDLGQGYLFSRPVPAEAILAWAVPTKRNAA